MGKFLYSLVDGIGRPKGKNSRQTFGTHSDKIKIPNSEGSGLVHVIDNTSNTLYGIVTQRVLESSLMLKIH